MTSQLHNKAFAALVRKLARKSCHSRELRATLLRYGFSEEVIESALKRAQEAGFIDDAAWLQNIIAQLSSRGKSNLEIRAKLSMKGIPQSEYSHFLPREAESLSVLIQKKYPCLLEAETTREARLKALAALSRRGFSRTQIAEVLAL